MIPFNVAVILIRHVSGTTPPSVAEAQSLIRDGRFSIGRFWRDATYGTFVFPRFDFFGWFDVTLAAGSRRGQTIQEAKKAAAAANVPLHNYDRFLVVSHPSTGLDAGAYGQAALVHTGDPFDFIQHEFGHVLGFDHSYGIPNLGGDQDGDGVDEPGPVYGDPYCIMSALTYADSRPTFDPGPAWTFAGFPRANVVGPPPSRAIVHLRQPAVFDLLTQGRIAHRDEGNTHSVDLNAAGSGGVELVAFHPAIAPSPLGTVYVEYRQPSRGQDGTIWDSGLADTGTVRDRAAVIVHVVRPEPSGNALVSWYAGRITLPTADLDLTVDTPTGKITVSIDPIHASWDRPGTVRLSINRQSTRAVIIGETHEDKKVVVATEQRPHPELPPIFGTVTWETRDVTRTARYTATFSGLGGSGVFDGPANTAWQWMVAGRALDPLRSGVTVTVPGTAKQVEVNYRIDRKTAGLMLSNRSADGSYTLPVSFKATATGEPDLLESGPDFVAPGIEEGWGDDYYRALWWRNYVLIPIIIPGAPIWLVNEARNLAAAQLAEIAVLNPTLARSLAASTPIAAVSDIALSVTPVSAVAVHQ